MTPRFIAAIAVAGCLAVTACSSSGSRSPSATSGPSVETNQSESATSIATAAQYVDAVNALCDDLLPKVMAVIGGGHPDTYPVSEFMAELPAHSKLERDFDAELARVPVPASATSQHAALQAYIAYANTIDAKRLAAAKRSQAAFNKEIRAENKEFPSDPINTKRAAAGFSDSCNAR